MASMNISLPDPMRIFVHRILVPGQDHDRALQLD